MALQKTGKFLPIRADPDGFNKENEPPRVAQQVGTGGAARASAQSHLWDTSPALRAMLRETMADGRFVVPWMACARTGAQQTAPPPPPLSELHLPPPAAMAAK